jgi:uracil-DNA glycosylase family 4
VREQYPDYHTAPVGAWGRVDARLIIVGLAPGMHGANRTGRPFTGDASGEFLFHGLARAGLATASCADDARLINTRITNAVKCLPPENRPVAAEIRQCRSFLVAELDALRGARPRRNRCVLCLGRLAHDAVAGALEESLSSFKHGAVHQIAPHLHVADVYHPSRLNTNTGRLTEAMLNEVLHRVGEILDG